MYEHFFNFFSLREDPFHVSPDPRFYYPTRAHESALAELLFGIETRQGFLVLTGEAGTGKTTLLNQLLDWLQRRGRSTAYVFHALLDPLELLQFILRDFGVSCSAQHKGDLVNTFHTWLLARNAAGDLPVLILDEAQALPQETLDELRLLLNLETPRGKLLQIILSGQPELDEKLRQSGLRQLRQRIMFHSRLTLLTQEETAAYISCRLAAAGRRDPALFPQEVVQDIHASSRGIPRVVNLLCEHALISAYAEQQHVVSREIIQRIATDFDLLAKPLAVTESEVRPHYGRLASFPIVEKVAPRPTAVAPLPAVKRDPVPAVPRAAPATSPEPVVPTAPVAIPGEPREIPKYWHRPRSRWAVAVFGRKVAAAIQGPWQDITDPAADSWRSVSHSFFDYCGSVLRSWLAILRLFVSYGNSVLHSFVRDCRLFFRALTLPTPALEIGSSAASTGKKSANHRKIIAPVVHWLRQPISPGHYTSHRPPARSTSRK